MLIRCISSKIHAVLNIHNPICHISAFFMNRFIMISNTSEWNLTKTFHQNKYNVWKRSATFHSLPLPHQLWRDCVIKWQFPSLILWYAVQCLPFRWTPTSHIQLHLFQSIKFKYCTINLNFMKWRKQHISDKKLCFQYVVIVRNVCHFQYCGVAQTGQLNTKFTKEQFSWINKAFCEYKIHLRWRLRFQ